MAPPAAVVDVEARARRLRAREVRVEVPREVAPLQDHLHQRLTDREVADVRARRRVPRRVHDDIGRRHGPRHARDGARRGDEPHLRAPADVDGEAAVGGRRRRRFAAVVHAHGLHPRARHRLPVRCGHHAPADVRRVVDHADVAVPGGEVGQRRGVRGVARRGRARLALRGALLEPATGRRVDAPQSDAGRRRGDRRLRNRELDVQRDARREPERLVALPRRHVHERVRLEQRLGAAAGHRREVPGKGPVPARGSSGPWARPSPSRRR